MCVFLCSAAIWFFRRRRGLSREWFTEFFKTNLAMRPGSSCIVYPEGTRSKGDEPLKLKTGVFESAWHCNLRVQAVITTNKEFCLDEKTFKYKAGVELVTSVSRSIKPADYETKELWFKECKQVFHEAWIDAYESTSNEKIEKLPLPGARAPLWEKVQATRLWLLRIILILILLPLWLPYAQQYLLPWAQHGISYLQTTFSSQ